MQEMSSTTPEICPHILRSRTTRRRIGAAFVLVSLLSTAFTRAQSQPPSSSSQSPSSTQSPASSQPVLTKPQTQASAPATISVNVKVVNLPVTVRDKHGQIVRDLTKDDFSLQEDGHSQTIKYFSQETNLPLTLGLLVDTSMSVRNVLNEERTASKTFLDKMLTNEKDRAFLIHFDREVELLKDLTSSKEELEKALEGMSTPSFKGSSQGDPNDSGQGGSQGGGSHHGGAGTLLYDAVYLASNELMKKQPGRKALVILSDGVDRGSKESLENAIEAAQRADTLVYSILFIDDSHENSSFGRGGGMGRGGGGWPGGGGGGWPGGGGGGGRHGGGSGRPQEAHVDGKKILERISQETGGRMFEVSKKQTIDQVYASIAEELRQQYELGYTPVKTEADAAGYHKITLTAKKKDLTVQTRDGYYAER
jgi:VWFA-related protein